MRIMPKKLVRDLIPEIIKAAGRQPIICRANEQDMTQLLKDKLVEESLEVQATSTSEKLKEELADVLEVLITLAERDKFSLLDIENYRVKKKHERGGFRQGFILEEVK